jgi:hypothetical protein
MTPAQVLLELLMLQKLASRLEPSVERDWLSLALNRACSEVMNAVTSPGAGLGCTSEVLWDISNLISGEIGLVATDLHMALNCDDDS